MTETIPSSHLEPPADLSLCLLEDPAGIDPEMIRLYLRASVGSGSSGEMDYSRLALILAVLYARPQLLGEDAVLAVTGILSRSPVRDVTADLAAQVLGLLACFQVPTAADALLEMLRNPDLPESAHDSLVRALVEAAPWVVGHLEVAALIELAALPHLSAYRDTVRERVIEPGLFVAPNELQPRDLDRLTTEYPDSPDLAACLSYLCNYSQLDADVRAVLTSREVEPLGERVRTYLSIGRRQALIVQNIADRQGDELIRVVPLMQALLDVNPDLQVTLVTSRPYLYAHPRVTLIPLHDRAAVQVALQQQFDVVAEFFESNVLTCNHDVTLRLDVAAYLQEHEPLIDLGADKGYNHFVYNRLKLEGRSCLEALALDRQRVPNVYETTFRLITALGLPVRLGEEQPVSEPVIAGISSQEAEVAWKDLTRGNAEGRPVALMNPFGGGEPLKGYVESRLDELADRIQETISQGFFVVLLPNGTSWGTRELALKVVGLLGPDERTMISVAADPAGQPGPVMYCSPNSITVPGPSYAMHLITHFIRFADCVVAVEGWIIHAAYCLGKPFRILMLPYSHGAEWHPYGRTGHQSLARPAAVPDKRGTDRTAAPLPSQPRKFVLLALLRVLSEIPHSRVLAILRWAVGSEDHDVRLVATGALRRQPDPMVSADLYHLLDDSSGAVRGEAAAGLLERIGDTPPGAHPSRDQLLAYRWIGQEPRLWANVIELGDAARPALVKALHDDHDVVRREAGNVLFLLERLKSPPVQHKRTLRQRRLRIPFRWGHE